MDLFAAICLLPVIIQCSLSEMVRISSYATDACPFGQDVQARIAYEVPGKLPAPCKTEDGWRNIFYMNMSDPNDNCPPGLTLYTSPFRLCGRILRDNAEFCQSSIFAVGGQSYSRVCGRIKAYQRGREFAFYERDNLQIPYLDGVSLTYGPDGSKQHIWSFVTAHDTTSDYVGNCPIPGGHVPAFITNDYFCDSGVFVSGTPHTPNDVYVDHPLWDGVDGGCDGDPYTPPRCYVNHPPWFHKTLSAATTLDIQLRLCGFSTTSYGDTLLQEIELYVK